MGDGAAQATAEDGEQTLMRWLASRDSIYQAVGAPWPTSLPSHQRAWLYDGLAARRVEHTSNVLSLSITWSGQRRISFVGLAGYEVTRPLTTATVEVRVDGVWQSSQALVIDRTTAALALAPGDVTGVRLTLNTGVSGTVHRVGEVLLGDALELPEPSTIEETTTVPVVVNGDYSTRVGVPIREFRLGWPPQEGRVIEDWVRQYGGESGLLWVDGRPFFVRLGTTITALRTIDHDFRELAAVTLTELEGASLW